jgi:hypothetical protein
MREAWAARGMSVVLPVLYLLLISYQGFDDPSKTETPSQFLC